MFEWFWYGKIRNLILAGFLVLAMVPSLVAVAVGYRFAVQGFARLPVEILWGHYETVNITRASAISGFVAAVLVIAASLPLAVIIARKLTHPLELLSEGADRIARGDYGITFNLRSNLEIEALAENFNKMSLKLKEERENLFRQVALLEEQKREISVQKEELARVNSRLELLSITDPLTGAYNRRYIISQLEQELAVAARHGLPLSLIMIDIDHFKKVNDTHGHQVGDEVLKDVVKVLSGCIRTADVLGRYGGEEFVVIAPFTGFQEALVLAERLRDTVSRWPFETTYGFLKLTISLGVTTFNGKEEHYHNSLIDRLLARADEEMYKAKAQGRNLVSPSFLGTV
ncbi:MAG: diguanylate cyclase [Pelotomaculum sp.]|uniref:Hypothetical signaling protein n=1 Tax=Pelotomaculum thermopropionicum (strain DSM 13744 / JCM 10971 / SI) TaxID=370438 RepID=A5D1G5_PELTS|nr:diguanylate cyclase [Pelotomaculum sp.]BAF59908.1 hypothetical signaling protein [Pelotomaculum thermopropionicum SI]